MAKIDKGLVIVNIALADIKPPQQRARHSFETEQLTELMSSIKQNGLINPITIKKVGRKYEVIAGDRRLMAFKKLGRKTIPAIIKVGEERDMEIVKYDENLKRADLTDIEESQSLDRLQKLLKCTEAKLAKRIGKSAAYVKQKIAIMSYPSRLLSAVAEKLVSFSAARELVRITDENILNEYIGHAVRSGITPSIAKQWADDWLHSQNINFDEEANKEASQQNIKVEEVMMPCGVCNKPKKASQSRMVRICDGCYKEMFP